MSDKTITLENATTSDIVFPLCEHFEEEEVRYIVGDPSASPVMYKTKRAGYRPVREFVLEASPPAAVSGGSVFTGVSGDAQRSKLVLTQDEFKALAVTEPYKSARANGWVTLGKN
jgi:hypothetical protein